MRPRRGKQLYKVPSAYFGQKKARGVVDGKAPAILSLIMLSPTWMLVGEINTCKLGDISTY